MNQVSIRQIIEARFSTQWADTTHVAYENVPYEPADETAWVRLSVQFLYNAYNGLGECREIIGMVGVQIYCPVRQGTLKQEQFSDEVVSIFRGDHNGIAYKDANIISPGENTGLTKNIGENWYQSSVLVNFITRGD